eukprot:TRINITY_DN68832_c0_g1_i1.p1 TRINITY_DN68832_c0_g1~~TRINITY_DN68832_c0_g1_i1.p1  ORF type:complete len:635 (-),score=84.44 TRINITY_DN68832_c0_g1_i1:98-2002(-)
MVLPSTPVPVFLYIVCIGLVNTLQAWMNHRLGENLGGPLYATVWNFLQGSFVLIVLNLLLVPWRTIITSYCRAVRKDPSRLVLLVGGALGATYVGAAVWFPPIIGYGAFFSVAVAGQLTASVVIDCIFPPPHGRPSLRTAFGALVVACGAWMPHIVAAALPDSDPALARHTSIPAFVPLSLTPGNVTGSTPDLAQATPLPSVWSTLQSLPTTITPAFVASSDDGALHWVLRGLAFLMGGILAVQGRVNANVRYTAAEYIAEAASERAVAYEECGGMTPGTSPTSAAGARRESTTGSGEGAVWGVRHVAIRSPQLISVPLESPRGGAGVEMRATCADADGKEVSLHGIAGAGAHAGATPASPTEGDPPKDEPMTPAPAPSRCLDGLYQTPHDRTAAVDGMAVDGIFTPSSSPPASFFQSPSPLLAQPEDSPRHSPATVVVEAPVELEGTLDAVRRVLPPPLLFAVALSFSVGLATCFTVTAACAGAGSIRAFDAAGAARAPWWQWWGGVIGPFCVASWAHAVGAVGVAITTLGTILGQTVGGLLVDAVSAAAGVEGARAPVWYEVVGVVIVGVGAALSLADPQKLLKLCSPCVSRGDDDRSADRPRTAEPSPVAGSASVSIGEAAALERAERPSR